MAFRTPIDIVNRALQHCGRLRIANFADQSDNAQEMAFAYHRVRRAELRRNVWGFAVRRSVLRPMDTTSMQLVPVAWSSTLMYSVGSVVSYLDPDGAVDDGRVYISLIPSNSGIQPDLNPKAWALYFGPMIATPWGKSGVYFAGEVVYTPVDETYKVYLSLASNNSDVPGVFPVYDPTIVYNIGDTVSVAQVQVVFDPRTNPDVLVPVLFDPRTNPDALIPVLFSGGFFQSTRDLNVNNLPAIGSTSWIPIAVPNQPDTRFGMNWLQLDSGLSSIKTPYPVGAGPSSDVTTNNVFQLPNGFLREAPQSPKSGIVSYLGAPGQSMADDWEKDSDYIVSGEAGPIVYRFVADINDVTQMDDMFCEGFAARLAREVAPAIVKDISIGRLKQIAAAYKEIMGEARTINGIEQGIVEPVLDDYLACRY